jgi:tRNA pseudouridine38-40 synthase
MVRYQAILTYDGTEFSGMQRQAQDRTVQGVVEEALEKIGWQGKSLLVAGRTDAGVHASGQTIAFDLEWRHTETDLLKALNASLPPDVAVCSVKSTGEDFHPRYDALSRRYRYTIFCQPLPNPLRERYAWRVWPLVDLEIMQVAAQHLIGEHDFSTYGSPPKPEDSTIRKILNADWQQNRDMLVFEVEANAFLYHMVRRLVIQQVDIGQGRYKPEIIIEHLKGKFPEKVQGLAPPNGLLLVKVQYSSENE